MQIAQVNIGRIAPPPGVPHPGRGTAANDYVAGFVRNGISLLIVVAFLIMFIWTILAGFKFITAGGDSKAVSSAWSQIYFGIIGMLVVVGSYAIISLVEYFFHVQIITGGLQLPI